MIKKRSKKQLPYDESCYERETKVNLVTHAYFVAENKLYKVDLIKWIKIDSDGNYFSLIPGDFIKEAKNLTIKTLAKIKEEGVIGLDSGQILNKRKKKR